MQVYESREDNLITEGVLIYGSGMRLRVVARVRIPNIGYAISIPVEVSNIQVRSFAGPAMSTVALVMAPHFPGMSSGQHVHQDRTQLAETLLQY